MADGCHAVRAGCPSVSSARVSAEFTPYSGLGWDSRMSRFEKLRVRREEIPTPASRYGARNVRVFGSVARGLLAHGGIADRV